MPQPNTIQYVPDEETETDMYTAERAGGVVNKVADVAAPGIGAYVALNPAMPLWARVGGGLVAFVKGAPYIRRGLDMLRAPREE